jgi:phage baseplate assembly protein W
MAEKALSLPFSIDSYGNVSSTSEQSKIWTDRVRSVLGTTVRERVMRSGFGTLIPFSLFDTESSAMSQVKTEVNKAFITQLALLRLDKTTVTVDEYTRVLTIEVVYALPNNEVVSTVVGVALIDGANPIYEELL